MQTERNLLADPASKIRNSVGNLPKSAALAYFVMLAPSRHWQQTAQLHVIDLMSLFHSNLHTQNSEAVPTQFSLLSQLSESLCSAECLIWVGELLLLNHSAEHIVRLCKLCFIHSFHKISIMQHFPCNVPCDANHGMMLIGKPFDR